MRRHDDDRLRMKFRVLCFRCPSTCLLLCQVQILAKQVNAYRIEIASTIYVLYSYSQPYLHLPGTLLPFPSSYSPSRLARPARRYPYQTPRWKNSKERRPSTHISSSVAHLPVCFSLISSRRQCLSCLHDPCCLSLSQLTSPLLLTHSV